MKKIVFVLSMLLVTTACTARNRVTDNVCTLTNPELQLTVDQDLEYQGRKLVTVSDTYGGSAMFTFYYDSELFLKTTPDGSISSMAAVLGWEPSDVRLYIDSGTVDNMAAYYRSKVQISGKEFKSFVTSRHKDSSKYLLPLLSKRGFESPDEYLAKVYYKLHSKRGAIFIFYLEQFDSGQLPPMTATLSPQTKDMLKQFEERAQKAISFTE